MSERESSIRARKFPGNFCKFCEPLEKFEQDSERRNFLKNCALVRNQKKKKSRRTLDCGVPHVHARQLCAVFKHLDVACRVAVASTNGERSMRSRGREVEKRVGSALSVTPKNGIFHRKSGLGRNLKERSSEQHAPVIFLHNRKSTLVNCVHFPSAWMSPEWNRINRQAGQV